MMRHFLMSKMFIFFHMCGAGKNFGSESICVPRLVNVRHLHSPSLRASASTLTSVVTVFVTVFVFHRGCAM